MTHFPLGQFYTLGWGQKSTFSEYGHVAYQNKMKSQMQQHDSKYFAGRHPPPQTMVMLHIKLKGMLHALHAATW